LWAVFDGVAVARACEAIVFAESGPFGCTEARLVVFCGARGEGDTVAFDGGAATAAPDVAWVCTALLVGARDTLTPLLDVDDEVAILVSKNAIYSAAGRHGVSNAGSDTQFR
jgi:hypothetical protein